MKFLYGRLVDESLAQGITGSFQLFQSPNVLLWMSEDDQFQRKKFRCLNPQKWQVVFLILKKSMCI